jgi:tetratricopeptide (TPR) repeat protein
VIELLIEAERAMTHGRLDEADRLYRQVAEGDPRNAIAVVGLARVALDRGDDLGAYLHARRALALDPDNPTAQHLVMRMSEVLAGRGEMPAGAPVPATPSRPRPTEAPPAPPPPAADWPGEPASAGPADPAPRTDAPPSARRMKGLVGRLFDRRRRT